MSEPQKRNLTRERLDYGLFWSWNVIFLAFMVFGFAPRMVPEVLIGVQTGMITFNFLIYALLLSMVPLLAVVLGLTKLRKSPDRLFALGYVVEGPLMLLLALRFFLIRQATAAFNYLSLIAILGMLAFLWYLLDPKIDHRQRWVDFLRLAGLTLMLLTSLYAAVWIAFYALPISGMALKWMWNTITNLGNFMQVFGRSIRDLIMGGLLWIPFSVLGFILLLFTASLFVVAPIAVPYLSFRAWRLTLATLVKNQSWVLPSVLVSGTVGICALLFLFFTRQPQGQVFEILKSPPATPSEARDLLENQASIRDGLLNSYLAPFRYMSSRGEVSHVRYIYENAFGISEENAFRIQQLYESMASPLIYIPIHPQQYPDLTDNLAFQREPLEAARLYQRFFDTPIVEGEHQRIVDAVRSNWSVNQVETAWQAVDDREVYLVRQEITLDEFDDWAEFELLEVYQNLTADNQEVIYYFNLPESAVITGLWLGDSPDFDQRFVFRISPRGAAQEFYREQTRRNIDPALLEQIGPRQYRLRIFPVPPIVLKWDKNRTNRIIEEAPLQYMWMTYRTFSEKGDWPLPHLAELRNVFWDGETIRQINGQLLQVDEDEWLPSTVPATREITPLQHQVDFLDGKSVVITPVSQAVLPKLPNGLQLAAVLDRSHSMVDKSDLVTEALNYLQAGIDAEIDVYLTASFFRGEHPSMVSLNLIDQDELFYFGGQNPAELLVQFGDLRGERDYDAVLVLTDGSGYELGDPHLRVPFQDIPIWMVHLGGEIPLGYDDNTLEAIQASGGGVAGDIQTVLDRLALNLDQQETNTPETFDIRDLLDGYIWTVIPSDSLNDDLPSIQVHDLDDPFTALAARRMILAEIQQNRSTITRLRTLDSLHALAKEYGIVTPYSSMIVLVTKLQEAQLNSLESGIDRFDREVESIGETTPEPQVALAGVPEPEEWLLIGLVVALLLWYASRRKLARQPI